MYCIYYEEEVVYDPFVPEEYAFNVTCNGGVNDKGSMRFSVGYGHRMYDEFKVRQGMIRFTHDDDVIFIGYIEQIEKNFNLDLEITCYGILGYLNDVLLRPYTTYQNDEGEYVLPSSTELFAWYIRKYNEKATHQFVIGYNEGNDIYNGNIFRSNTSISPVGTEIENQLISTLGGYVSTRVGDENWYIDYKKDVGDVNSQIIDFGVNLLDYTYTDDASGVYTAVVVTGGTDENGNEIKIKDATTETDGEFSYVDDTITALSAAQKYGYRETHYSNTDAETASALVDAAVAYLKIVSKPDVMIVCKAIDMALYMDGYKHLAVGEIVRVRSVPHNVDEYMVVTAIDVNLDNPENTEYTLGIVYDTLTGEQSSKLKDLNNNLDRTVDSVGALTQDVLDAAEDAKNALDKSNELEDRLIESEFERAQFEQAIKDSITDLQKIADGAIETWFFPYSPSPGKEPTVNWETDEEKYNHIGDLFYNTETGKAYRWMYEPDSNGNLVYSWGPIIDTDIEAALKIASQAKDTADSKRRVFYDTPYPPYDEGDLWAQGYGGDILMSTTNRESGSFNSEDWVFAAKYNKAVYSTEEWFYQSDSPDELIGGAWSLENTWVEGKYTWRRTLVTYGDGTSEWEPSEKGICISGNTGDKGEDGVGIVSVDVWYSLSKSSTDPLVGSVWQTDPPKWVEGRYMWTKTVVSYTNGKIEETDPVCIALSGKDGTNGLGVSYMEEQYFQSSSNTTVPGDNESGWTNVYPGVSSDKPYIWTRTVIHYSDGSSSMTYPVCVTGPKGSKGDTGTGVSSIVEHYLASVSASGVNKNTPGWSTDPTTQVLSPTKKYLWNYTTTDYTDGRSVDTTPAIIGVYGDKGEDGKNGTNGTNGKDGSALTGTSSTDATTLAKVASVDGFAWKEGVCIAIVFTNANNAVGTTSNPLTLKVNTDSSRNILTNGSNSAFWRAGDTVIFVGQNGVWNVASSAVWASTNTIGNPVGKNVYIDGSSVKIRNGTTDNATFSDSDINLGANSTSSQIHMCANTLSINTNVSASGKSKESTVEIKSGNSSFEGSSILLANLTNKVTSSPSSWVELRDTGLMNLFQVYMGGMFPINISSDYSPGNVTGIETSFYGDNIETTGNNFYARSKNTIIDGSSITIQSPTYQLQSSSAQFTGVNYTFEAAEKVVLGFNVYKNSTNYPMYGARRLFTGTLSGTSTGTLTENAANFTFMDIIYDNTDGFWHSVRVVNPNGKSVNLISVSPSGTDLWLKTYIIYIDGTQIKPAGDGKKYGESGIHNNGTSQFNDKQTIRIGAVYGWK